MKQQREISLAGTTFPFQSASPAAPLLLRVVCHLLVGGLGGPGGSGWAPSLGETGADAKTQKKHRSLWHYRVVPHSWHSPQIRGGGSKPARSPTKGNMKKKKRRRKKKHAPRLQWGLSELSSWIQTVIMSVGSNLPLSETSPTMASVWTGGGKSFISALWKNPLFPPLVRPVSKVWVLRVHLLQQTRHFSCSLTPALTFSWKNSDVLSKSILSNISNDVKYLIWRRWLIPSPILEQRVK